MVSDADGTMQVNGAHDNESNTEKVPNPSTQTPCAWLVFLGNIQTGGCPLKCVHAGGPPQLWLLRSSQLLGLPRALEGLAHTPAVFSGMAAAASKPLLSPQLLRVPCA